MFKNKSQTSLKYNNKTTFSPGIDCFLSLLLLASVIVDVHEHVALSSHGAVDLGEVGLTNGEEVGAQSPDGVLSNVHDRLLSCKSKDEYPIVLVHGDDQVGHGEVRGQLERSIPVLCIGEVDYAFACYDLQGSIIVC